jgi:nucleoside-diphosphate-sugar epimerase
VGRAEGRGEVALGERIRSSGARFAVTGATGWLGRAAAETLAEALGPTQAAERLALFASRPRTLALDAGPALAVRPLTELPDHGHDVLLHYAFVTRERIDEAGLEAYVRTNLEISATVLDAIAAVAPSAVVYASSGAVHGADGRLAADLAANPYGTLKHLDELALRRAAADRGARSLVLRVFNTAGPWLLKPHAFALSDLVLQAAAGGPLVLRATGPVLRSYVDVADLAAVAIAAALEPGVGDDLILDTAGDEVVEVGDLAARVAAGLGRPDLPVQRTWDPHAPADEYVGDGTAFRALAAGLGVALRGLDEQIARTAHALQA